MVLVKVMVVIFLHVWLEFKVRNHHYYRKVLLENDLDSNENISSENKLIDKLSKQNTEIEVRKKKEDEWGKGF